MAWLNSTGWLWGVGCIVPAPDSAWLKACDTAWWAACACDIGPCPWWLRPWWLLLWWRAELFGVEEYPLWIVEAGPGDGDVPDGTLDEWWCVDTWWGPVDPLVWCVPEPLEQTRILLSSQTFSSLFTDLSPNFPLLECVNAYSYFFSTFIQFF